MYQGPGAGESVCEKREAWGGQSTPREKEQASERLQAWQEASKGTGRTSEFFLQVTTYL